MPGDHIALLKISSLTDNKVHGSAYAAARKNAVVTKYFLSKGVILLSNNSG